MIKFFRKIRYNLMEQNKTGKYFKYALGEIVLVVIGILIALQVNNWNEYRKERNLEIEYISRLNNEMKKNLEEFEFVRGKYSQQVKHVDLLIDVILEDTIINRVEDLAFTVEFAGNDFELGDIRDVWDELIFSGNLKLIRNIELKDKISEFHRIMEINSSSSSYLSKSSQYVSEYGRLISDLLHPRLRSQINYEILMNPEYTGTFEHLPSYDELIIDLQELKGIKGTLANIKMRSDFIIGGIGYYQIPLINEIIKLIETELLP